MLVERNRYFQQIELRDSGRLMLSTLRHTQIINLANLKNYNQMADKLGVLNISNSKKHEY